MSEETYEQIKAERDTYRAELSAVMPKDYKDWWQNSKLEWPLVAALTIANMRDQNDLLIKMLESLYALHNEQLKQLRTMWAGSARSGRWLFDGDECSNDTEGAEWEPYTDKEQAAWLRDGIVPLLERLLFAHDDEGKPIIPPELLKEHGFNEEPEDDTIYPRTHES